MSKDHAVPMSVRWQHYYRVSRFNVLAAVTFRYGVSHLVTHRTVAATRFGSGAADQVSTQPRPPIQLQLRRRRWSNLQKSISSISGRGGSQDNRGGPRTPGQRPGLRSRSRVESPTYGVRTDFIAASYPNRPNCVYFPVGVRLARGEAARRALA